MVKRMLGKHNKIVICILAACLALWGIGTAVLLHYQTKREAQPVLIETLAQESYYFPAETQFTAERLFAKGQEELRLVYARAGMCRFENKEAVQYIEKEEKAISAELPVFQKNGATVYLPEEFREYWAFCTDFTIEPGIGEAWLSYGAVFNTDNVRAIKKDVFLIDWKEGLYLSTLPLALEGYQATTTISANAVLQFMEDCIQAYEFIDGVLVKREIPVSGLTMVSIEDVRTSYYNLYQFCKDAETSDTPSISKNGLVLEGDYFYYFLGQRYEINGPCLLYETKEGLYLENEVQAFLLPDAPIYEADSNRIFLARDYMMLQMNQHRYNCLPSTATVRLAEEAVYVTYQDTILSYQEILLHDGEEHYVVLNASVFRMDDIEINISPLSSIYITDSMEICFYQYDSGEYVSIYTEGKAPELELSNGDVVLLYDRLIKRTDGTLDLLQKNPSVFPIIQ